jgi:mono/diheme cytochrome c family protein
LRKSLIIALFSLATLGSAMAQDAGFSAEQAARGEAPYRENCGECHGVRMNGGMGPALNAESITHWQDASASDFYAFVKDTMPAGNPGGLEDDVYLDIVAYLLTAAKLAPADSANDATLDDLTNIVLQTQ